MKQISRIIIILWVYLSWNAVLHGVAGEFKLTLLHTNDWYDRIEETAGSRGRPCTPELQAADECFGGVARRATAIKEVRENSESGNVLLVDTGDRFQGSDWFYVYKGNATAHFVNLLGYDFLGLGKNEFLIGVDGLVSFLDQLETDVVSSNTNTSNENRLWGRVNITTVARFGDELVGVIGITKPETPHLAMTENVFFDPAIEAAQNAVDYLKRFYPGINKIIALCDASFGLDQEIAQSVEGIDIVIGGHHNTFLYTGDPPYDQQKQGDYPMVIHPTYDNSLDILLVTAYAYGKYLGHLDVVFDDDGVVTSYTGNPIVLDKDVSKDTDVQAEVDKWKVLVDEISSTVVGSTEVDLDGSYSLCGKRECNMGNVLADAMVASNGMAWDARVAMITAGSIASSIDEGDIIVHDVTRTLPYGDTIDLLELSGESILDILEKAVEDFDPSSALSYSFLQFSGMHVEYDLTKENGDRVYSVDMSCASCDEGFEPLEPDTVYKVIAHSYLAGGQEGFSMIPDVTISRTRGNLDVDVTIEYFTQFSPISAEVEGRIVLYDENNRPGGAASLQMLSSFWLRLTCTCMAIFLAVMIE